jgi:hypothetical protein
VIARFTRAPTAQHFRDFPTGRAEQGSKMGLKTAPPDASLIERRALVEEARGLGLQVADIQSPHGIRPLTDQEWKSLMKPELSYGDRELARKIYFDTESIGTINKELPDVILRQKKVNVAGRLQGAVASKYQSQRGLIQLWEDIKWLSSR